MTASALANGFASFLSAPHVELAAAPEPAPAPVAIVRIPVGSYERFDVEAGTVDMRLPETDDGETALGVIYSMMEGDAALPDGPYTTLRTLDFWASEMDNDPTQKFTVLGLDAVVGIDWTLVLQDDDGVFGHLDVGTLSYDELRAYVNETVSRRLGGVGAWHASSASSDGDVNTILVNIARGVLAA